MTFSTGDGAAGQNRLLRIEFDPCNHRVEFLCDRHKLKPYLVDKKGKVRALSGLDRTGWSAACPASFIALIASPDLTFAHGAGAAGQHCLFRIELHPGDHRSELLCDWHKIKAFLYERKNSPASRGR